jgi:Family of unknown function (DUF6526)
MSQPQTYKNHARWYPPFHFVLVPLLLINLGFSIAYTVCHRGRHIHAGPWWIALSVAFILLAVTSRFSALKVQDRIIRLEERLRLTALGVPHATIYALTERQMIGLRFASDAELPTLAERAVREKLTEKQLKASIQSWRPDYFRV